MSIIVVMFGFSLAMRLSFRTGDEKKNFSSHLCRYPEQIYALNHCRRYAEKNKQVHELLVYVLLF